VPTDHAKATTPARVAVGMSPRRPVASPRSNAIPSLVAVLAAGLAVEGCLTEAHAQPAPASDAGVRPPPPPRPPRPPPPPAGAPMMVHPVPSPVVRTPR
jgi:hypothetical protein